MANAKRAMTAVLTMGLTEREIVAITTRKPVARLINLRGLTARKTRRVRRMLRAEDVPV